MTDSSRPEDDALLEQLGALYQQDDPMPGVVREGGVMAFGFRDPDARLAELLADSADLPQPAGVRGAGGTRSITCRAGSAYLELGMLDAETGDGVDLVGLLAPAPPGGATVTLQRPGAEPAQTSVDDGGTFTFAGVARGSLRLKVGGPEAFTTPWFTA